MAPESSSGFPRISLPAQSLSREEIDQVLQRVPLIVVADDDPSVRIAITRIITGGRDSIRSALRLQGDMEQCFEALSRVQANQQPVILCSSGAEAETATRIISERKIDEGLLLFDQRMGLPEGLDIFMGYQGVLSPRITRALISGTMPSDIEDYIKAGVLDAAITKPPDKALLRETIARVHRQKLAL